MEPTGELSLNLSISDLTLDPDWFRSGKFILTKLRLCRDYHNVTVKTQSVRRDKGSLFVSILIMSTINLLLLGLRKPKYTEKLTH